MIASDNTLPDIQLTSEQTAARDAAVTFYTDDSASNTLSIGGYAGTGKTVLIKAILDSLNKIESRPLVGISAFTGKAVSVLRRKGINSATTLHSMLYTYDHNIKTFILKSTIPYDLIIIDEASMVNSDLNDDLLSFGKPVIYVGDMGQLEPIGKNPNVMANPDITLTEIHRQAKSSPIIRFSQILREGKPFKYGKLGEVEIIQESNIDKYIYDVEQIICGFNLTRHEINAKMREYLGYTDILNVGDKLICLQNNRTKGVYNGTIGKVKAINDLGTFVIDVDIEDDTGTLYERIKIDRTQLGTNKKEDLKRLKSDITQWDYGYAITCHKAQGSEWESVLVLEQIAETWNYNRWAYTAATRASTKLVYCR